jgi:hypothetical protein
MYRTLAGYAQLGERELPMPKHLNRWQPDDDDLEADEVLWGRKASTTWFLTTPEQLPAIPGDGDLYLTWDADYSEGKDQPRTVLLNGDQVLFTKPASWEAIEDRYEQFCRMVRDRYGTRVRDLVPTAASEMWLYRDKISGPILRAGIRDEVFR